MDYVVGIDEVGRGALAGPVVVAAVAIPRGYRCRPRRLPKLKDSKRLSPRQREAWYLYAGKSPRILSAHARVYQRRIDKLNISRSADLAASRALEKLLRQLDVDTADIFLDGGLHLGYRQHRDVRARTVVRGDQKLNPIKLASIVAKVTRDRYLNTLEGRYPGYGLGRHKGYGTRAHFQAITELGVLDIHRESFLRKSRVLS